MKARRAVLTRIVKQADVVLLQEVHGNEEDFATRLPQIVKMFKVFVAEGVSRATGGVAILVRRRKFEKVVEWVPSVFAEGRILRLVGVTARSSVVLWSIHNFAIQVDELRFVAKRLQDDFEVTIANFRAFVWAGGDWNFLADGEGALVPDSAGSGFFPN